MINISNIDNECRITLPQEVIEPKESFELQISFDLIDKVRKFCNILGCSINIFFEKCINDQLHYYLQDGATGASQAIFEDFIEKPLTEKIQEIFKS